MSDHAERVLYSLLTDVDALEYLVRENFDPDLLNIDLMRPVVAWTLEQYLRSGCLQAPSREALMATWGKVIEDAEIELEDEDVELDTIEWVLDSLRSQRALTEGQAFNKRLAQAMWDAPDPERVKILQECASELMQIALSVSTQRHHVTLEEGVRQALRRFEGRRDSGQAIRGMRLGYPEVDEHLCGIHEGELAVLAAGPKVGKSTLCLRVGLEEAKLGRRSTIFTLENSVDMTVDRALCMDLGIDYRSWQRGTCTPEEVERVRDMESDLRARGTLLQIIKPEEHERTAASIVRQAQILNTQSLIVDQLTFMGHPDPARKPRHQIVAEIMRDLKNLISSGRYLMPCLLAHQINREGVKAAEKTDHLEMYHLAESSEVERTADLVLGLYQSDLERIAGQAKLQILAARRESLKNWAITWRGGVGYSEVLREIVLT